jgi:hypothetical protein
MVMNIIPLLGLYCLQWNKDDFVVICQFFKYHLCIVVSDATWLYDKHDECLIGSRNFASTLVPTGFFEGIVLLILVFYVVLFGLFVFVLCLVWPMSLMSLVCPFLITPSVFSYINQHVLQGLLKKNECSSIKGFWLPLWYLQTFLTQRKIWKSLNMRDNQTSVI